ncbi:MAG: SIMPL domain-containing protein [Pseudomonadota bacterium]
MNTSYLPAALVLALGVAVGGWFVADGLVTSREPLRTVVVKGLAERAVRADLGFWPVRFVATGSDLEQARAKLEQSETLVRTFMQDKGFTDANLQVQNITVEDRLAGFYSGQTSAEVRYVLTEEMLVRSEDVTALAAAAQSVADLLRVGVVFTSDAWSAGPSFIFTGINDLKTEMLAEATTRAREAAQQFATESHATVGNIQSANQGVFEVLPAVEIPNDRPEKQIDKRVRVVTTITYFLE